MSVNRQHIIICTSEFPPQPGGIGNHAYNLAKQLQHHEFHVKVITDQRSMLGDEELDFDKSNAFETLRIKRTTFRFLMYIKRLLLLLKHVKKADIVFASGKFSLWIVAFVSLFYQKRYIAVVHGTEVNFTNTFLKYSIDKALHRFETIVAVSNFTKSLIDYIKIKDIVVIPNGFNHEVFSDKPVTKTPIEGYPKLVTVGNVTERKGQLNVIKHLPVLTKIHPKLKYHCVGLPTEKEAFLSVAKALNVEQHVRFHGRLSNEKLQDVLQQSDIFVMLSGTTKSGDVEGFGIAVIEANAMGLPAIGSKGCGIEDAILDKKSGLLVRHDNTAEFKDAVLNILDHYERYVNEAQVWAKTHQWDAIVKQYIKILVR
ncbi:glycosyltransferase family 4 protein [uncultured Psychroserpens sp.]|uniref:glycosyltransferase family 4 protein n=1 Tax=uncultured Psychroserpens sp. TaxID=255436 RepID=UPI0026121ECE|nr:glycosyltransferase family 4 protein [uncultured Psychroserpens sp.]